MKEVCMLNIAEQKTHIETLCQMANGFQERADSLECEDAQFFYFLSVKMRQIVEYVTNYEHRDWETAEFLIWLENIEQEC